MFPEVLKLYLVVDICNYGHSEAIIGVFFNREKAEEFLFLQKDDYSYLEIQELEFNTQNGQVKTA